MDAELPIGASADESAAVSGSTDTSTVDRASMSDDELLGIGSYEREEPAKTAEGDEPAAVEAKPDTQATEAKPSEAISETSELPALTPEKVKQLLESNPELRNFYFAERAYRDLFPTVAEARELRGLFPSVQDAGRVMAQAETLLAAEQAYVEQPDKFLQGMAQGNPEAFARLAQTMPETLYSIDPGLYRSTIGEPAVKSMLANMSDAAAQSGDEALAQAVAIVAERLFQGQAEQAPLPNNDPRLVRYEQMEREAETRRAETVRNFDSTVQRTFIERLDGSIDEAISKLSPSMSPKALARVRDEVVGGVVNKLTANQWLSREAQSYQRSGSYDSAHVERVVGLIAKHAKPLVAPTVKAVMEEWTSEIVRANNETLTDEKRVAARKEVGAGNGNGFSSGQKKVVPNPDLYANFTDAEIMEHKHLQ